MRSSRGQGLQQRQQRWQQERPRVAFLGPSSSYTHQAAKLMFPEEEAWHLEPVPMIEDVFKSVRLGNTTFGVVPFENSTHGPVTSTLAALADREQIYGSLVVCDEVYLAVHHCLVGKRQGDESGARALTAREGECGASLNQFSHITRLYSHPQAFGQTMAFVRAQLSEGVEMVETSSTSRAAELAAADRMGTSAAISSEMAAETMRLDVLARCIEDRTDNTTRFYVLCLKEELLKKNNTLQQTTAITTVTNSASQGTNQTSKGSKSLVSFTVPHQHPGALTEALDCFRRNELNLTSINSLPGLVRPFQYTFLVEFEPGQTTTGDNGRDLLKQKQLLQQALDNLAIVAETWRLLGTWITSSSK